MCAKVLTSGGFQLTERLPPFRHPRAYALGRRPSAHTRLNRQTNSYLNTTAKTAKWQLGVSLSLTSASARGAPADNLTGFLLSDKQHKKKKEKANPAKTGFALTRLQSPVFTAAHFYHIFSFPLPPLFSFSERLLLHGSSRKSTAAKSSLKICTNVRLLFLRGFSLHLRLSGVT